MNITNLEKQSERKKLYKIDNFSILNHYNIDKINRNKSITLKRYFIFIKLIKAYNPQISQNSK